MKNDYWVQSN